MRRVLALAVGIPIAVVSFGVWCVIKVVDMVDRAEHEIAIRQTELELYGG